MQNGFKYKISILMACYNSERYIRETLDSLVSQSLKDIQIICIDDASTDNTVNIIEVYQRKDDRISLICQPRNGGQAKARNKGLEIAEGEFITMVDSDDVLSEDSLELLYNEAEKSEDTDAVLFSLVHYYEDGHRNVPYEMRNTRREMSGRDAAFSSLSWDIHGCYAIRNDIHKKFPYDESCKLYGDDNITHIHFLHCRKVRVSDGKYYYRQHERSATHKVSVLAFDWIKAADSLRNMLRELNVDEEMLVKQENIRWGIIVDRLIYFLKNKNKFNDTEKEEIRQILRSAFADSRTKSLYPKYKYKPGYSPTLGNFSLFLFQIRIYYTLRLLMKSDL